MKFSYYFCGGCILLAAVFIELASPTCVLESDFGFKINCAFKKSGLFRVRNLGGVKAHASLGFSLGDELGFEQSLTNLDPSRRRSVSLKNGSPNVIAETTARSAGKQEKRGKQNRIMMRPPPPGMSRPSQSAMNRLASLHRQGTSTMRPIIVSGPTAHTQLNQANPTVTIAKPYPMGVPPFRPLPPKEDTLKVLPIAATTKTPFTPLQVPQSKGPGLAYPNPAPVQIHELANNYLYNTKKVDDYNTISGYGDDTQLKFNKEDINAKIKEIAIAGNISMEAVEAAISLRQQQLLNKYANLPMPTSSTTTSSSTTTTTTEASLVFQPEPEEIVVATQKPKRVFPTTGKVMNAPREYYPVGYEKNFDDQFQSKVDLPETNFHCGDQKYFPGLYGDENLGCMVFHVCALTDDGLVMKSFLCPESTLFDQTILKCNWWFYVDCKNTRRLYDTNIPVSKSYQLMKALTFFSSYKKDMQDKINQTSANPEDEEGIREAISILENQSSVHGQSSSNTAVHIVTPQPLLDERNNHRNSDANETYPVYRGNRNFKVNGSSRRESSEKKQPEFRLVTVNADFSFNNETKSNSAERSVKNSAENLTSSESAERKYRRRLRLAKNSNTSTAKPKITTTTISATTQVTTTNAPTTTKYISNPSVEILNQEISAIENLQASQKQETLIDQVDTEEINRAAENLPPFKRFYRSSAEMREKDSEIHNISREEKEISIVNNEKVQVIRPTSTARLVGESPTSKIAIAKLDEAILGKPFSSRFKKSVYTIVTPTKLEDSKT